MFKNGDDLRQDMLTIQLLRLMDEYWLEDGFDMRLKPYDVMATGVNDHGAGVGMIMPVTGADTISSIQVSSCTFLLIILVMCRVSSVARWAH